MSSKQFANTLKTIVGVLVGSTVAVLALAYALISDADYSRSTIIQGDIEDRIKPVGSVHVVNGVKVASNKSEASISHTNNAAEPAGLSLEQLYNQACAACHMSGVLNAPKLGDKAGWESRIEKGVDQLYASAINGIGVMPPKGGRIDFSDDDIKKIVDYMLQSVQ